MRMILNKEKLQALLNSSDQISVAWDGGSCPVEIGGRELAEFCDPDAEFDRQEEEWLIRRIREKLADGSLTLEDARQFYGNLEDKWRTK